MKLREKYSAKKSVSTKNSYSSFWFDRKSSVDDMLGYDMSTGEILDTKPKPKKNHIVLAGHKRAIGNFVRIVSGKNIPVKFASRGDSFTDGKSVTISANIKEKNFDHIVGLALHEGSHIAYSDFELLHTLRTRTHIRNWDATDERLHLFKSMMNYIEDRRIDSIVFKSSPGYKGYYHKLYAKYQNHRTITKGLKSKMYRDLDFESYMFRIINFTNSGTDLDALPRLRDIYRKIDMKNILRLKSSSDVVDVAESVCDIIFGLVNDNKKSKTNGNESNEYEMTDGDYEGDVSDMGGDDTEIDTDDIDVDGEEVSERVKNAVEKLFEKEKELLDGNTKKTKLTQKDKKIVDALSNSRSELVETGDGILGKVKTVLIPELTKELIDSKAFGFLRFPHYTSNDDEVINEGLRLGTILGKKLKVRGEERNLLFNRQSRGKIDKRLLAELGFDNENVFSQVFVEKYNKANLHISIDASGSMGGTKLDKAKTSTVAMIKAANMSGNIHVTVSFRWSHEGKPIVIICYDSRKDKLTKIKSMWTALHAGGTTPESLCYEAMMKNFLDGVRGEDNYFINYSDGEPYFTSDNIYYHGGDAERHCKKMMKMIRNNGIKVMSYFIYDSDWACDHSRGSFTRMYGKDASFINPTNMMEVAKSMNKKFLEK